MAFANVDIILMFTELSMSLFWAVEVIQFDLKYKTYQIIIEIALKNVKMPLETNSTG